MDMEKPCEICGDVGWVAAIRICSKCKITLEHAYCMRVIYNGDPEKWICEECETPIQKALLKPVPQQTDFSGIRFKIKKPPQNTKTKYIPLAEAMMLESGAVKNSSLSMRKPSSSSRVPMNNVCSPRREPVRSTPLAPNFVGKSHPQSGPPGFTKPLNLRSVPSNMTVQNVSTTKDKGKPVAQEEVALQESPARTGNAARSSRVSNFPVDKESRISLPEKISPRYLQWETPSGKRPLPSGKRRKIDSGKGNTDSGHSPLQVARSLAADSSALGSHTNPQPKKVDHEPRESAEVATKLDQRLPNCPAASPRWKGSFKVHSDFLSCGLISGIQAHPPCKVHSKVYDLLQQFPKSLEFELLPRLNLWSDLFEDDAPGGLDIGLYFLPSERNEPTYVCLVECLNHCDMLMKTQVDDVVLLISSSKHLKDDSQRINQRYFLWGVFRTSHNSMIPSTSKANVLAETCENEGATSVASEVASSARVDTTETSGDQIPSNESERPPLEEDMDVDMIGGQEVGQTDVVIPRPKEAVADPPAGQARPSENRAIDTLVGLPPIEVKKEPNSSTITFEEIQQELDRQVQASFDRFDEIFHTKEATRCVKVEVKAEEAWGRGT